MAMKIILMEKLDDFEFYSTLICFLLKFKFFRHIYFRDTEQYYHQKDGKPISLGAERSLINAIKVYCEFCGDAKRIGYISTAESVTVKHFKNHDRITIKLVTHTQRWNLRGRIANLQPHLASAINYRLGNLDDLKWKEVYDRV